MKNSFSLYLKMTLLYLLFLTIPREMSSQLTDWVNYTHGDVLAEMYNDGNYLWVATEGGLVKFNKSTEEKTFYTRANTNRALPEHHHLRSITKDKNDNIWVGSQHHGIGRFNGTGGISFFPEINQCYAIKEDGRNNIWFSGDFHINKYNGTSLQRWTVPGSSIFSEFYFLDFEFDKDSVLWLGGYFFDNTGYHINLAKFTEEGGFQFLREPDVGIVRNIEIDNDSNVWIAGSYGLAKYKNRNYVVYNVDNSDLPMNSIQDIKIDESGIIWLVGESYLVQFNGGNFISHEIPLYNENDLIFCMEVDPDGTVWLGSRRSGLIKYKDGIFRKINVSNSPLLTNNIAFDLDVDPDGNVWLGTRHNLVHIDPDDNWSSYYEAISYSSSLLSTSRVTSTAVSPAGELWVALGRSDTCAVKIKNGIVTAFTVNNSPLYQNSNPKFFFDRKGNTWISSQAGLYKYNGSNWQRFTPANSPLNSYQINGLAFDRDDNLWGTAGMGRDGYNGCVFKYDGTSWTIYTENGNGLPSSVPTELKFDSKGILWIHFRNNNNSIGTDVGNGLTRFDGTAWTSYTMQNSGIPSNTILDIEIDKNDNLWLATYGTNGGITKFDGTNWEIYDTSNSGLVSGWVSGIALDYHRDMIWITHLTNGGISVAKLNFTTKIEDVKAGDLHKGFTVYPNPAKTEIEIRLNQGIATRTLDILDISGRIIGSQRIDNGTATVIRFQLSDLNIREEGIYFIRITGQTGTYTQKLLVKY